MPKTVDQIASPPLPEARAYIVGDRGNPIRRWHFLRLHHPDPRVATDDLVDEACEALNALRDRLCAVLPPDDALRASPSYRTAEVALARVCNRARRLAVRMGASKIEVAGNHYFYLLEDDAGWSRDDGERVDEEIAALLDALAYVPEQAAE